MRKLPQQKLVAAKVFLLFPNHFYAAENLDCYIAGKTSPVAGERAHGMQGGVSGVSGIDGVSDTIGKRGVIDVSGSWA